MSRIADGPFAGLPRGHFGAILADPPWHYVVWAEGSSRTASSKYPVMENADICALPVLDLAAPDCVLFIWATWPKLYDAMAVIEAWGFEYKTCGFDWMKADNTQPDFFQEEIGAQVGMGYWTRANTEPCLLATRGKPKRLNADVRQGIIAPRREHSRKPDGIHERIERLVAGPYIELFARQSTRPGWTFWGNETAKFGGQKAPADPYADNWPDAAQNSAGCYATAIEALRRKLSGTDDGA